MISINNLTKDFGDTRAVDSIDLEISEGQILGILGPNGAGKTTTLRMLTGYIRPTSGTVVVNGIDANKNSVEVKNLIGYLPESSPIYTDMLVYDYLNFIADIRDISNTQKMYRLQELSDLCGIREVMQKPVAVLSKGYKQRVGIAQAIINDPEVLILDEPTIGLDPVQIIQVRNLIKSLEYERTVILSTHILSEIQQIAQRVLIIKSGEVIIDETLENLLREAGSNLEDVFLKLHSLEAEELL
ncbi:MAG: ATP-binding cassette domain-containing protein [Spirochaetales bacterium]|nr:ATP-binding cassette domain-containing protein [Spirochaetales bacterium]